MLNQTIAPQQADQFYDLVIHNQEEFNAFVTAWEDGTLAARTVAILSGEYTLSKTITPKAYLLALDGFGLPKITLTKVASFGSMSGLSNAMFLSLDLTDKSIRRISGIEFHMIYTGSSTTSASTTFTVCGLDNFCIGCKFTVELNITFSGSYTVNCCIDALLCTAQFLSTTGVLNNSGAQFYVGSTYQLLCSRATVSGSVSEKNRIGSTAPGTYISSLTVDELNYS